MTGPPHSRRRFVRILGAFAAAAWMPNGFWTATALADAQAVGPVDEGLLRLQLSDFPALQKPFGSIRIGTSPVGSDHRPTGLFYPVLINRAANGDFFALDAACTHEGCTVPTYDAATQEMQCPCHGSRYFLDGTVKNGPANFPLRQFPIHYDGSNSLSVELPDISFAFEIVGVVAGAARLHLQFIGFDQIEYELFFRASLTADWGAPVLFSTTPNGPLAVTSVVGQSDYADIYVARPGRSGFYGIAMKTEVV